MRIFESNTERGQNVILGALVADSASLGLHWLYDQNQIAECVDEEPEFIFASAGDYQNKGYFAHPNKKPGDHSQYGAQLLALVDGIKDHEKYDELAYIRAFREWFDFGGKWQGYIDHPTKSTLLTLHQREADEESLLVAGADDTQLPAVAKLAPLVAKYSDDQKLLCYVESAVRVTNNNDKAVDWAKACVLLMQNAMAGLPLNEVVSNTREMSSPFIQSQIDAAISKKNAHLLQSAQDIGLHCDLPAAFPLIILLIIKSETYSESIRQNILCGGDSCGRATILGAVLGAHYGMEDRGIPQEWLNKLDL